jgi:hypothetical protein
LNKNQGDIGFGVFPPLSRGSRNPTAITVMSEYFKIEIENRKIHPEKIEAFVDELCGWRVDL